MKRFMKKTVTVLLVLSVLDAAMIVGNLMGNQFPWVKATVLGAAMVIFAVGFMIGGACEKGPKRSNKHIATTPHIVEKK